MIKRSQFLGALVGMGVALFILGIGYVVASLLSGHTAPPTHIETDNLRYLDPSQFKAVGCEADGVTWPSRADGGCYTADRPGIHDNRFSDNTISGDVKVDGGTYVYDGTNWWKAPSDWLTRHCLQRDKDGYIAPIPNCIAQSTPAAQPSDDPGPMQGQWMDSKNPNDELCTASEDIGMSLTETDTYFCASGDVGPGMGASGNITSGTLPTRRPTEFSSCYQIKDGHSHCETDYYDTPPADPPPAVLAVPHAGPTYGQWLTPDQMRAIPPAVLAVPPSENDNSEELEQDDNYTNDINQGSRI